MGILTLITLVPFVAVGIIMLLPAERLKTIKQVSLVAAGIDVALAVWLVFDALERVGTPGPAGAPPLWHVERYAWLDKLGIEYYFGVDGVAVLMILLTAVVIFCGVLASWRHEHRGKEFFAFLLLLVGGVFGVFASQDLFLFFLFYEIAVLPMYLLIGLWGTGPKEYSAMKLTLMLMGGSALIVVGILVLFFQSGSPTFAMESIARAGVPLATQAWVFPLMFFGFGTLGGLWPFHTWSPDGHASAPTAVSMLHAGVLMKLGGYGCLKVIWLMPEGAKDGGSCASRLSGQREKPSCVGGGLLGERLHDARRGGRRGTRPCGGGWPARWSSAAAPVRATGTARRSPAASGRAGRSRPRARTSSAVRKVTMPVKPTIAPKSSTRRVCSGGPVKEWKTTPRAVHARLAQDSHRIVEGVARVDDDGFLQPPGQVELGGERPVARPAPGLNS